MKKYLAIMGSAILIMVWSMPAGAQMLTKSYGHMEIQTVYEVNPDFKTGGGNYRRPGATGLASGPGKDVTYKDIYERFRWFVEHGDSKSVKAVIGFEADSSDWGEPLATSFGGGRMGRYTADTVQLEIKWAYLDFVIPNTPIRMTAGIQPWNYGGRFYINNDAPGAKITANFAPHRVELGWWRENDGGTLANNKDGRLNYEIRENYAVEYDLKQKDFGVNVWGVYTNQNRDFVQDHPWYLGVAGKGKVANFDLSGQVAYMGGTKEDRSGALRKWDYSAFIGEVLGYYQIGPGLKVGAEFFYSTGNDGNKQEDKLNSWMVATDSEARSGFGNDRTVFYWMASGVLGYQFNKETSFDGFWYGRVTAEYAPVKWLTLIFNYLYIADTSSGTPGTDRFGATKIVNSPTTSGVTQAKDLSYVGSELNVIAKINIYKGFGYNIGIGYFIPGEMYDLYDAQGNKTRSADPAWALNTRLRYDF